MNWLDSDKSGSDMEVSGRGHTSTQVTGTSTGREEKSPESKFKAGSLTIERDFFFDYIQKSRKISSDH